MTTPTTVQVQIQLRADTAANWTSANPTLLANELGLESDTKKIKIGDGTTAWNSLSYFPFVVSGGTVLGNLEIGTTGTLTFEGSSADNFETTLGVINPTADRTINLPNVSGTIITTGDTGTVTSTMIADGTIANADINASAAIAHSKLANITAGYVLIGNASNVPTETQVTGDVTISSGGVTAISSGVIVDADISGSAEIAVSKLADGAARQLLQTDVAGTGVEWTDNVDVPGTLDVTGAATFDGAVTIAGDLTVNGTTTNINTQNLVVEDKNVILGDVATPTDLTADGGGITLKGATDKTINWVDATDAWTLSEHVNIASGKEYRIAGTKVLDATSLGSSVLITSANITDGTIVNGDINASAAIAGTKISPDFGSQTITTTGIVSHALGTAGAPTVTFTGDTNTGIYSPGADQLALASGGTQRLLIDSSGNINIDSNTLYVDATNNRVGVLTSSPTVALDVAGIVKASTGFYIGSDPSYIYQSATDKINIRVGSDGPYAEFTDAGSNVLRFGNDSGALALSTASTERLRITSTGAVGIGTSSPWNTNTIKNIGTVGDVTTARQFGIGDSSTYQLAAGYYQTAAANPFAGVLQALDNGSGTRLLLNPSGGNVGIGTTNPGHILDVNKAQNAETVIQVVNIDSGSGAVAGFRAVGNLLKYADFRVYAAGNLAQILGGNGIIEIRNEFDTHIWLKNNGTEKARLDSSGRLLVGTSSARANFFNSTISAGIQLEGAGITPDQRFLSVVNNYATNGDGGGYLILGRSKGGTVGSNTVVASNDQLGAITFQGNDGTEFVHGALIEAYVDGTPGANDMPGRIVLSTTLDGASSPTEALRITNDRVVCYNQPDVTSKSAGATLTIAELKTGIIQYTGAAATLTLPTGTLSEGGFSGIYTNMTFEWSVINTGSGTCTIGVGTGHTIVGGATIAAGASGRFASRRTAANTFVSYRLS